MLSEEQKKNKTLYGENIITIGMFDQKSHKQELSKDEYLRIIEEEFFAMGFYGATILTEGIYGIFRHDDGTVVKEPSIRLEIAGKLRHEVMPLVRKLRERLNQESILYRYTEIVIDMVDIDYSDND